MAAMRAHPYRATCLVVLASVCFAAFVAPALGAPRRTIRVSISSSGAQGRKPSTDPSISGAGRRVAFVSSAKNFVTNDTNGEPDVFVRNVTTGTTTRVSVSSTNEEGNGRSANPSISKNGRWVAFASNADNLVANDTNGRSDIFVHDLETGTTARASVSSSGSEGNGVSHYPSISARGKRVAFEAAASNLVPNDTNGHTDVFVHELGSGETTRVSVSSSGRQGNSESYSPSISAEGSIEGRYIAFTSAASNLVRHDTNGRYDVFLHDLRTQRTRRVSISGSGKQANRFSYSAQVAIWTREDGHGGSVRVAFASAATNLVPGDTNGHDDVFIRHVRSGRTTRLSLSSSEKAGNGDSTFLSISAKSHKVTFESTARNLVRSDNNGHSDIFVRNLRTGRTRRVSVGRSGREPNRASHLPSISANGSWVGFDSLARTLIRHDTNGVSDVFLYGRS